MFKSISDYFKGSWQEISKVTWPDKKRAGRLALLVIISMILATAIVALIDFGLSEIIDLILKKV